MADTVTGPEIVQQNDKRFVVKLVNQSDGTGSTTVMVDISALAVSTSGQTVTRATLQRLWFSCAGGDGGDSYARLDFEDSDGDRPLLGLTNTGYWDFREFGGLPASRDDNTNGDINFVVPGAADAGNMYSIVAEFIKEYS
jgi:hypothetical protein